MPYIHISVKQELRSNEIDKIKLGLGKAIELITGKKEEQLMIQISDNCTMFHRGEDREKIAYVDMRAFKNASYDDNRDFTSAVFELLYNVLGVPTDNIYVNITEYEHWGSGGILK